MRKIISLTLAALMLVTLLLTATSCELSMEAMTGYTQLRDHLIDTVGENQAQPLDVSRKRCQLLTFLFNIVLVVLADVRKEEKRERDRQKNERDRERE